MHDALVSTRARGLYAVFGLTILIGVGTPLLSPSVDAVLLSFTGLALVTPVLVRWLKGTVDPLEPTVVFMLAYGVMFVVRPLAILASDERVYIRSFRVIDISETYTEMLAIALMGAAAFMSGYALPSGGGFARRLPRPVVYRDARGFLCLVLVSVALAVVLIFVLRGGGPDAILSGRGERFDNALNVSSSYLWAGVFLLVPASLALFILGRERSSTAFLVGSVVVAALLFIIATPVGSRMMLLPFAGATFVMYFGGRRKRRMISMVVVALLALFASTVLLEGRTTAGEPGGGVLGAVGRVARNPTVILEPILRGGDTAQSLTFASALRVVPEDLPHRLGAATVGDFLVRPIPREWWSEKPQVPRLTLIEELWPVEYAAGHANPEFSALMWLYWDWSYVGVVIGMMSYGFCYAIAYRYYIMNSDYIHVRVLYGLLLGFLVILLRDSPVSAAIRAAFVIAPIWLLFFVRLPIIDDRRSGRQSAFPVRSGVVPAASKPTQIAQLQTRGGQPNLHDQRQRRR